MEFFLFTHEKSIIWVSVDPSQRRAEGRVLVVGRFREENRLSLLVFPCVVCRLSVLSSLAYASGKLALPPTEGGQLIRGAESLQFLGLLLI